MDSVLQRIVAPTSTSETLIVESTGEFGFFKISMQFGVSTNQRLFHVFPFGVYLQGEYGDRQPTYQLR